MSAARRLKRLKAKPKTDKSRSKEEMFFLRGRSKGELFPHLFTNKDKR